MDLTRKDFRAMIFYDFKSSLSPHECSTRLQNAFGVEAPHLSTVRRWYAEFNRGRVSLDDEFREGRPSTAVTEENVAAVRRLIEENRRITYDEIRGQLGIGMSQIQKILHENLKVRKLCCRWIPHELTSGQKRARVDWCQEMLRKYKNGCSNGVYNIVTGDETWIYCYDPEKKQQSSEWVFEGDSRPTKIQQAKSVAKQMIACFFSKSGHVCTVLLNNKRTVNAEWYTTTCLPTVFEKVRETRPRSRILLHHDNASPHTAKKTKAFLSSENVETVAHPPYSPDLAPCDFYLFPKIKDLMRGLTFKTPEDAVATFNQHVENMQSSDWVSCFEKWFERMNKCIKCKGEYFEKQ